MIKKDFGDLANQAVRGIIGNKVNTSKAKIKKPTKKAPYNFNVANDLKNYLEVMAWYDRSDSISAYLSGLVEKDKLSREADYIKAQELFENRD